MNYAIAGKDGGFPRGRCTLITGLPDSGKTSVLLETIALAQKNDPSFIAGWLESENSLTRDYICNTFGIDPSRFVFMEFNPILGAEQMLDAVKSILSTGTISMFCINSLKCLIPRKEQEASLDDALVAVQARLNSRMTRKFTSLVSEYNTAFCLVCHLSTDIGSMSRDPLIISGGHAIKYWSSLTLDLRKKTIMQGDLIKPEEGIKVTVRIKKNHCRPDIYPYKKVDYYAIFGEGIEQIATTIDEGLEQGILKQRGAWLDWYKNGEVREKWNGKAAFRSYMHDNPDVFQEYLDCLDGGNVQEMEEDEISAILKEEDDINELVGEK